MSEVVMERSRQVEPFGRSPPLELSQLLASPQLTLLIGLPAKIDVLTQRNGDQPWHSCSQECRRQLFREKYPMTIEPKSSGHADHDEDTESPQPDSQPPRPRTESHGYKPEEHNGHQAGPRYGGHEAKRDGAERLRAAPRRCGGDEPHGSLLFQAASPHGSVERGINGRLIYTHRYRTMKHSGRFGWPSPFLAWNS